MNDENIKEILDNWKYVINNRITVYGETIEFKQIKLLLDYIINLQRNYDRIYNENCKLREEHNITDISLLDENNRLQKKIKNILNNLKESALWYDDSKDLLDYITNLQQEKKDYKSRCEKGIEYNNQIIKDTRDFYRPTTDIIYSGDSLIEIATNNINILQNGSDSE